ncbi:class I SAM-dependent methyltransferase [Nostoc sp. NMS8]|uniref:class I SAM-dependent methyltransferase n=1 Tax=Nostoc sp. NMS8 TaxID=2815392 RepID=UPI0025D18CB0|nr:class I SAM-dependent methyltransferase [Nostoc sp. NMS8]MBN3960624.1 class I SAM-dependent methyltransferase [Nostoc sp. NMS8]
MANATLNCPLCCSNNILQRTTVGTFFKVWRCGECTFTWVDRNDLARPEAAASYDNYGYNRHLRSSFEQMKPLYIKGLQQRISRRLSDRSLQNCAFLDVGCANGEYLWTAKSIGFGRVAGVEIDSSAAKLASVYGEVVDDVEKFAPFTFDVVQIKNVLSNIPDFVGFLSSCLQVLKPDGFLLLDNPNQDSLTALLRNTLARDYQKTGLYGHLRPPHVINGFNLASIKELYRRLHLTPTYISTSYIGTSVVPYYPPNFTAKVLGLTTSFFGKGSLLITEGKSNVNT